MFYVVNGDAPLEPYEVCVSINQNFSRYPNDDHRAEIAAINTADMFRKSLELVHGSPITALVIKNGKGVARAIDASVDGLVTVPFSKLEEAAENTAVDTKSAQITICVTSKNVKVRQIKQLNIPGNSMAVVYKPAEA